MLKSLKKYFLVGILNTVIGYCLLIILHGLLNEVLDSFFISYFASFITIGLSILTYRSFVFKSRSDLKISLKRGYFAYIGIILITSTFFKILVDYLLINIYISQLMIISISWILTIKMHGLYTFAENGKNS